MKRYLNPESDFEIIDGKKCLKDGRVLRVHQIMMDSANTKTIRISDGSGSALFLCRPGWRMVTDQRVRQSIAEERLLDRLAYLDSKDAELKNTSPGWAGNPPTGFGTSNMPGETDAPIGSACTIRGPDFVEHFGGPGKIGVFRGRKTCIPVGVTVDAADAKTSIYDEYDFAKSNEWRGDGWRTGEVSTGPNLQKEENEEYDEDDDDEDDDDEDDDDDEELRHAFMDGAISEVVRQTSTHHESQQRRTVPDRLQREHDQRMKQLGPTLQRQWAANDRIAQAQHQHQDRMDALYRQLDQDLQEAYKK